MMKRNHSTTLKVNLLLQEQAKEMAMLLSSANKSKTKRWVDTEFCTFVVQLGTELQTLNDQDIVDKHFKYIQ